MCERSVQCCVPSCLAFPPPPLLPARFILFQSIALGFFFRSLAGYCFLFCFFICSCSSPHVQVPRMLRSGSESDLGPLFPAFRISSFPRLLKQTVSAAGFLGSGLGGVFCIDSAAATRNPESLCLFLYFLRCDDFFFFIANFPPLHSSPSLDSSHCYFYRVLAERIPSCTSLLRESLIATSAFRPPTTKQPSYHAPLYHILTNSAPAAARLSSRHAYLLSSYSQLVIILHVP